jgi:phosphosulfolactate synthase (CoM biosynthesis protein A)
MYNIAYYKNVCSNVGMEMIEINNYKVPLRYINKQS